jgi:hypothetical protein
MEQLVVHGVNTVTHSTAVTESENRNQSFPGTEARATKEGAEPQTAFVARASRNCLKTRSAPKTVARLRGEVWKETLTLTLSPEAGASPAGRGIAPSLSGRGLG